MGADGSLLGTVLDREHVVIRLVELVICPLDVQLTKCLVRLAGYMAARGVAHQSDVAAGDQAGFVAPTEDPEVGGQCFVVDGLHDWLG